MVVDERRPDLDVLDPVRPHALRAVAFHFIETRVVEEVRGDDLPLPRHRVVEILPPVVAVVVRDEREVEHRRELRSAPVVEVDREEGFPCLHDVAHVVDAPDRGHIARHRRRLHLAHHLLERERVRLQRLEPPRVAIEQVRLVDVRLHRLRRLVPFRDQLALPLLASPHGNGRGLRIRREGRAPARPRNGRACRDRRRASEQKSSSRCFHVCTTHLSILTRQSASASPLASSKAKRRHEPSGLTSV